MLLKGVSPCWTTDIVFEIIPFCSFRVIPEPLLNNWKAGWAPLTPPVENVVFVVVWVVSKVGWVDSKVDCWVNSARVVNSSAPVVKASAPVV